MKKKIKAKKTVKKPAKKKVSARKRPNKVTLPGMQGPVNLDKPIHLPGMGRAKLTKRQALKRFV